MSQENVEVVRRVYADWERGRFRSADCFDPSVRVVWVDPIFAQRAESTRLPDLGRSMAEFLGLPVWDRRRDTGLITRPNRPLSLRLAVCWDLGALDYPLCGR